MKFLFSSKTHIIQHLHKIYIYIYIYWQSSAPGDFSTLETSVVLYSLTQATLMTPGKDETRVCGHIHMRFNILIYFNILDTLMTSIGAEPFQSILNLKEFFLLAAARKNETKLKKTE